MVARLAEIQGANQAAADDRRPVELDQSSTGRLSRMGALQIQAMAKAAERLRRQELVRIEATLKRIDNDAFGACVACGNDIAPERLAADPTIPTCIACADGAVR